MQVVFLILTWFLSISSHSLHQATLPHPDARIASLSLQCLLAFKSATLSPYKENLLAIAEPHTFREGLLRFPLHHDGGNIQVEHRETLLPVLLRLLYGRCLAKHKGGGRAALGPGARRAAVMSHLAACSEKELRTFMLLMIHCHVLL